MANANVVITSDATFQKDVLESEMPVLVDFWATWCRPCVAIAPAVDALATEKAGKLKVAKLDVQANNKIAVQFGVTNIPMFLVFKGGKVVAKQVGTGGGPAALKKLVEPHLS